MNTRLYHRNIICLIILSLFCYLPSQAQVWKRLQKTAERTVERKLDRKTEKETGKAMDSALDPDKPSEKTKKESKKQKSKESSNPIKEASNDTESNKSSSNQLEVYSKFDFVSGDKVLFTDDFSQDFIGDFPSKWNTNGSGEVVKLSSGDSHWFQMKPGHSLFYIPDVDNLPEEYTIEFDLTHSGITKSTSSGAHFRIYLSDNTHLGESGDNTVYTSLPINAYNGSQIHSTNTFDKKRGAINSKMPANIMEELNHQPHIAIAVNKNRYRLWVNERKYLDIPRMIEKVGVLKHIKFNVIGLNDDSEKLFISNLKIAEGGEDLRRTLLSEGKISTNGILFNSGSSQIKPQSMGIVLQISQVLQQDKNLKLQIVGHTDADGDSKSNLKLSKERAQAVKTALIEHYNISEDRLQTDGKGQNSPVADNKSADGKAQNRRVEFIKI